MMDYQRDLKRILSGLLLFFLLIGLLCICSCSVKRAVQKEDKEERVRVEYREILKTDTVTIQLPPEHVQVVRQDSSYLETSLAASNARIQSDGTIYHTLWNKPFTPKIEVKYKDRETIRDSIVYQTKEVPYFVEKGLNWWQKIRIRIGECAILTLLGIGIFYGIKTVKRSSPL